MSTSSPAPAAATGGGSVGSAATGSRAGLPIAYILRRTLAVAGHVGHEAIARPRATDGRDVPVSRKSVTREWLTAVLCRGRPGAAVEDFETADASSGTSTRWTVSLSYNDAGRDAGLPTELFAKTTLAYRQRMMLGLAGVIAGEPAFFAHFRPGVEMEAPQGYYGGVDERSWRSLSLIEDISLSKAATFCTPETPISLAQMEDLLANMAAWHGRYWSAPELARRGLNTPARFLRNVDRFISMQKRSKVGAERARSVMPAALVARQDDLYRALGRSLEIASQGALTLLHGDSHIGNTYITGSGRMGFTDWQVIQRGCWAYDFAYTVNSGLAVEDRRLWGRHLLAFYLEQLMAAGGDAPDLDAAWLLYRQHSLWPYFAWVYTIGRGALQPKMQPDEISIGIIERTASAIVDLDTLASVGS
jgi:hypothetical protein